MNNNINFLKRSKTKNFREKKRIHFIRIMSVLSLLIVSGISVALFFINTNVPIDMVAKEEALQKKSLEQLRDTAVKLFITQNRIKDITSIINKRKLLDTILGDIGQAVSTNINVTSLTLDGKNFSLIINSSSLSSLDTVITTLVGMVENKKIFTKITLEGLSVDTKEGNYIVSLSGNLP